MNAVQTKSDLPLEHPRNVVSRLLSEAGPEPPVSLEPVVARCVATLERRAPETVATARAAGVDIEYLGIAPLFAEPRFYEGDGETDWVFGPADQPDDIVVPRREGRDLTRLTEAGLGADFVYIAHEVPKEQTADLRAAASRGERDLSPAQAKELVGPVPPPARSVALDEQLSRRSTQVTNAARRSLMVAGAAAAGVVAAPVVLVGGALASLATVDPVIVTATPVISGKPGSPASWFVVARWDW
jgi:hypothetical protein